MREPPRRSFFRLQRTPAPPPRVMGYLVAQGLAVVLLGDYAIATVRDTTTVARSLFEATGMWKQPPTFARLHSNDGPRSEG